MSRYIDADALIERVMGNGLKPITEQIFRKLVEDAPSIDIVRCAECRWARPRTLKGETGYRCVFYRVDKAESGYCDVGERRE